MASKICFLVHFMIISILQSYANSNTTDLTALLDFKNRITEDPLGIMLSWNDSTHHCNWRGITCDPSTKRVQILSLISQKLVGTLPPSIGNLSFLTGINLRFNAFSGEIPYQIGFLSNLKHINLTGNMLSGFIPPQLGLLSNLKHINLTDNMLSGFIPHNLGNCSELTVLALNYNQLSGEIPKELSSLTKLEFFGVRNNNFMTGTFPVWIGNLSSRFSHLSLSVNRFHGGIPPEIGRLSGLTFLRLSGNQFSGELPASIYNLSSLSFFTISQNRFHGTISRDIGLTLPNLVTFACALNNFTGEIPISLANASRLALIDFSTNNFRGSVPSILGNLPFLYWINLEINLLGSGETGDLNFISPLTNCTHLRVLSLFENRFGGELPTAVANLSRKLEMITFGRNQMHGSIPLGFGSFENLTYLSLESNHFTGTIPHDIGRLRKLNRLHLQGNAVAGEIPSSLGNLTSLTELYLNGNKLQGSIPPQLGNCTRLLELNVSSNNLTGNIPKEVMSLSSLSIYLGLARNAFSGPLPDEVGRLVKLKELEVSGNKLSGPLPSSFSSCLSLEILMIGGNEFEGPILESLEALRGLEVIDFSHNNLSGKIPEFLGKKLPFLTKLDLSYNNLEGEVFNDGIFSNATVISVVGNEQLCGGAASLNLSPCSVPTRKSDKNLKLRRIIAVTVSLLVSFLLICSLTLYYILRKPKKNDDSAPFSTKEMQQISYLEIYRSTNGFSAENLIGSGSFGSVYKGILSENSAPMAVKVFNLVQEGASKSFMDECAILKSVRHRNLLKIITVCSSIDHLGEEFKCLITEFMINGSLDAWLHHHPSRDSSGANTLNIMQRLNIAIDVATAVDYLHNHSHTPIIHCDLKPSNVLLDGDLTAHVADFGLAKVILQPLQSHSVSVELRGSIGYIPPEYGTSTQISTLGDVYSYGILLLELFTGKRPTEDMFNDGLSIHEYVAMALSGRVAEVLDPSLNMAAGEAASEVYGGEWQRRYSREIECLATVLKIGVSCSVASPEDRTPISTVVKQLNAIRVRVGRAN